MRERKWISRSMYTRPEFVQKYRALRAHLSKIVAEINWIQRHGSTHEGLGPPLARLLFLHQQQHEVSTELADLQNDLLALSLHENEELYRFEFQLDGRRVWVQVEIEVDDMLP